MTRPPKYAALQQTVPTEPKIAESDRKVLARLVSRYGRKMITALAQEIPPPGRRGRPSRGLLPYYERMHLAHWFEDGIAERREAGSRTPVQDTEHELYNLLFDREQQRQDGHFERWRKSTKKKRLIGQRELRELRELRQRFGRAR